LLAVCNVNPLAEGPNLLPVEGVLGASGWHHRAELIPWQQAAKGVQPCLAEQRIVAVQGGAHERGIVNPTVLPDTVYRTGGQPEICPLGEPGQAIAQGPGPQIQVF
jgi:hypothetical protein